MTKFKKGNQIRNKLNGLTYTIIDILSATYEIKGELPPHQKWLLPFEDEDEWELVNEEKNNLVWKDVKKELPIIDDDHEEGEIPYLGIYCDADDYDEENEDFPFMDIVYFYGRGWKNSRWEKIIVKYWMEIPQPPK